MLATPRGALTRGRGPFMHTCVKPIQDVPRMHLPRASLMISACTHACIQLRCRRAYGCVRPGPGLRCARSAAVHCPPLIRADAMASMRCGGWNVWDWEGLGRKNAWSAYSGQALGWPVRTFVLVIVINYYRAVDRRGPFPFLLGTEDKEAPASGACPGGDEGGAGRAQLHAKACCVVADGHSKRHAARLKRPPNCTPSVQHASSDQ